MSKGETPEQEIQNMTTFAVCLNGKYIFKGSQEECEKLGDNLVSAGLTWVRDVTNASGLTEFVYTSL